MIRTRWASAFALLIFLAGSGFSFGELSPEFQLGARGTMSLNGEFTPDENASAVNDFSDSGISIGFRQKLYSNYRSQMVVGFQFPDADSDLGQIFFNQMFLKVDNRTNLLKMGRSRVRSSLIEFPTLRDDDALAFTDVLNPFSSGQNSEDNQYGNVIELSRLFGRRVWFNLHGEHFPETPIPPQVLEEDFSLNALGASLEYRVPETQRWNRQILDQIGLGFNEFPAEGMDGSRDWGESVKYLTVSTALNLYPDPVHFVDLRHQTLYNLGLDGVPALNSYTDLTRAKALATFTSIRYLYRKLERPTAQLALSFGFKSFPDLTESTSQWQVVANGFYRLGSNFDVGVQVQHTQYSGDLQGLYGKRETRAQFALTYAVEQSWNNQFDERDSLLNLEHGYIP